MLQTNEIGETKEVPFTQAQKDASLSPKLFKNTVPPEFRSRTVTSQADTQTVAEKTEKQDYVFIFWEYKDKYLISCGGVRVQSRYTRFLLVSLFLL